MIRQFFLSLSVLLALGGTALAQACPGSPLQNGYPANANGVMDWLNCKAPSIAPEFSGVATIRNDTGSGESTARIVNASDGAGSAARLDLAGGSTGQFSELTLTQFAPSHSGSLFGVSTAGLSALFENTAPSYGSGLALGTAANHPVTFGTSNAARVTITGSGNVGIGTASPAQKLHVDGTIRQAGCTTATTLSADTNGDIICTPSDARLKNIHGRYHGGLGEISRIVPVRFRFKPKGDLPSTDFEHAGFIAQDIRKIIPQAVALQKNGYYTLDTTAILAASVNAIQELKAGNDRLTKRVARLEAELNRMQDRLARMESARLRTASR